MSVDNDAFDPQAVDDAPGRSQYMTRKDLKIIGITVVIFCIVLFPFYKIVERRSEKSRCSLNMKAIMDALNQYATEHDNRFPPIARTEGIDSGVPTLGDTGHIFTWASDIAPFFNVRASFKCPSADSSEVSKTEDPSVRDKTINLTYGMYLPMATASTTAVDNPDSAVVIAETSNHSGNGAYDPKPLESSSGSRLDDGFEICWDNSNSMPDDKTKTVTRLAFVDVLTGRFDKTTRGRHDDGIHALSVSGRLFNLKPGDAYVTRSGKMLNGNWPIPSSFRSSH